MLSDTTIKEYVGTGKIKVTPDLNERDIRPIGLRLHINGGLLIPVENQTVDLENPTDIAYREEDISEEGFVLRPNAFVLASTHEKIQVDPDISCRLDGRSTIARLGVIIHCTSATIDGNHDEPRSIVLEIKNLGVFNVVLRPKMPIGMLVFSQLTEPIAQKSQSQYRNQSSVEPPNLKFRPGVDS